MLAKNLAFPILLMVFLTLTSCTAVVWENPISPVEKSEGDRRLPGAWGANNPETGGNTEILWIGKPVDGWMSFAFLVEGEKGFGKMYVSKIDKRTFLNVRGVAENGNLSKGYLIVEYKIKKKRLGLYYPEGNFVKHAIEVKELSGVETEEDALAISSSSEEIQ